MTGTALSTAAPSSPADGARPLAEGAVLYECRIVHVRQAPLRHAYLVRTDDQDRARVDKELYVSPYHPVDGWYQMSLPRPAERLAITVTLNRPNGDRFVASVRGTGVPATRLALLQAAARHPCSTAMVSARIRWQGIKLYARGLRPVPRPARRPQEGVQ